MAFLDFLHPKPEAPEEFILAVPICARAFTTTGAVPKENYVFYAFLFEQSATKAVARLRKEIRDEGFELLEVAGKIESVPLKSWSHFVEKRFGWISESLPTADQIRTGARAVIYYTPKIVHNPGPTQG
jgi:hypothetical protein